MSIIERPAFGIPAAAATFTLPQVAVAGNDLTLFEGSQPLIAAMIDDIRGARRRVWLESYIVADDAAGRAIADALLDRAAAGVEVRLMYDAIGCHATPRAYFDRLTRGGVQVHAFHAIRDHWFKLDVLQILNRRNHRKLLVVDDEVAYFGGMNIVDQRGLITPADTKAMHLPASAGWRDLHVRLVGPKQAEIAAAMDYLWGKKLGLRRARRPRWHVKQKLAAAEDVIHLFASQPGNAARRMARVFVPLIRRAREEILVSMAYFIPVGRVLRELLRARRRGVRVRVVIPRESDVPAVHWATLHLCQRLLRRGIQIYERRDLMLHSKLMVIDHRWTAIGSANLDPRSLRTNLEFVAVVRSTPFAAAATAFCHHEIAHSDRIRLSSIRNRPCWQRVRDRLAWSIRRWL
jgi:cardiolipin synthase